MAKATLSPVQFHGSTIFVVTHKGEPYAPIKPIVEDMGLTGEATSQKVTRQQGQVGYDQHDHTLPHQGTKTPSVCPSAKLPAFFASINPNKVRSELRDRIRLYQDECDDALWNYWTKGQATRKPKTALPAPAQLSLPAAEPLFDEAPLLELAEDIRRAQQTYRNMYADMLPRVFRLAFPIISAVERRLTNKKYPPFSELRPYSQMDNYLTELLPRSLSSLAERLPDQHNPAMVPARIRPHPQRLAGVMPCSPPSTPPEVCSAGTPSSFGT